MAVRLLETEQGAGVAHREPLVLDHLADRVRELQQADRVRDRAAILADALGDLVLRQAELVDEPLVRRRLFDRTEVGALKVLDERALEAAWQSTSWTTTGTSWRPARCDARQRRSPAIR